MISQHHRKRIEDPLKFMISSIYKQILRKLTSKSKNIYNIDIKLISIKIIIEMRKSSIFVCVILILQTNCYFLDLSAFLSPALGEVPVQDQFVEDDNNDNVKDYTNISKHKGKLHKGKKIHKGPNRSSRQWYGRKKNQRYNLRKQDYNAQDLYKQIGIPQDVIDKQIIPVHMEARYRLNCYFYKGSNSKKKLYASLLHLKRVIDHIKDTYLENLNNLVIGQDNLVAGSNIMMKANNHKVIGHQNFIFNNDFEEDVLRGDNVVRIDRFDIYLEKINRVLSNPNEAVVLLDE